MGAGDFLKKAWGATQKDVAQGLKAASNAVQTGEQPIASAAKGGVNASAGAKAAFQNANQQFSSQPIDSITTPCPAK